ncbi:hypothetical protein ACR42D_17190 [Desulfovibrio caledoniensis]
MNVELFIEELPTDPFTALYTALSRIVTHITHTETKAGEYWDTDLSFDELIECMAIISVLTKNADINYTIPDVSGEPKSVRRTLAFSMYFLFEGVKQRYNEQTSRRMLKNSIEKYSQILTKEYFYYEFSDGDLSRIQDLISTLRSDINSSTLFTEEHRRRLLLKLEKLQTELHKKMSSLDRFWGIFSETGVMLGKFGNDAKPFVDRIREIAEIGWRSQARAEELPSDSPLSLIGKDTKELDE